MKFFWGLKTKKRPENKREELPTKLETLMTLGWKEKELNKNNRRKNKNFNKRLVCWSKDQRFFKNVYMFLKPIQVLLKCFSGYLKVFYCTSVKSLVLCPEKHFSDMTFSITAIVLYKTRLYNRKRRIPQQLA